MNISLIDQYLESHNEIFINFDAIVVCELAVGHFFPQIGVAKLQDDVGVYGSDVVGDHFDGMRGVHVLCDGDLSLEGFHEHWFFIELFHVHLFYGVVFAVFSVANLEDLAIGSFAQEDLVVPLEIFREGELITALHCCFKCYKS